MQVTLEIPQAIAEALDDPQGSLARRAQEALLLEAYRQGRISRGMVGEALGLDYWGTEDFFRERQVPLNYRVEDWEADLRTLRGMFPER